MNYPLISEYIEAIKAAEENFEELKNLRPVLDEDGVPVMTSGNFAVVFKMKDEQTGKMHAVKCFLKDQEGRAEAYRMIAEELEYVNSTFLTPIKYLDKELFVDSKNSDETEFPVLLMDWVEGQTLDKYIQKYVYRYQSAEYLDETTESEEKAVELLANGYELENIAYQFSCLAIWLLQQPFAHGDLKPDNIIVKKDGRLVLVDYDGMYVPAMKGQKARELGSPDFRHPLRNENDFDEHIDDFPLSSILLSLLAIANEPSLLEKYGGDGRLLLSERDYRNIAESEVLGALRPLMADKNLTTYLSLFYLCSAQKSLFKESYLLFTLPEPEIPTFMLEEESLSTEVTEEDLANAWTDEFGVKYSADKKRLLRIPNDIKMYSIRKGTLVICNEALGDYFSDAESIATDIIIPNTVKAIGDHVFSCCRYLEKITIPQSVKQIGKNVFCGCDKLRSIFVPKGTKFFYEDRLPDDINEIVEEGHANSLSAKLVDDDNFWIDGYGVKYSIDKRRIIKVPKDIKDYCIIEGTKIICDHAFAGCLNMLSVVIPESVEVIGNNSFFGCKKLESIIIPQNVRSIGDYAFTHCENIKSISLPNSLVRIGSCAFCRCKGLNCIVIPFSVKTIKEGAFSNIESLSVIEVDRNNLVYDSRDNCNAIIETNSDTVIVGCATTIIPRNVTKIGCNAFYACHTLSSLSIPEGVIEINWGAFQNCSSLQSLSIPEGVTSIDDYAFSECKHLKSVSIPRSVSHVGKHLFRYCDNLESIIIPIGTMSLFEKMLPDYIFKLVEQEEEENLSTTVTEEDLANAWTDEYGVKYSADRKRLLYAPEELEDYSIKKSTVIICENAFSGDIDFSYYRLKSIYIPNSVRKIGSWAFRGCCWLTNINIPDSIIDIGDGAFADCTNIASIIVDKNNVHFDSMNNCNAIIETSTNTLINGCKATVIPDSVKVIGALAFRGSGLTDIIIPDSVKVIGLGAFEYCYYLERIVIPSSIKCIGDNTFYGCQSLDEIVIPSNVHCIGANAFSQCSKLKRIWFSAYIRNIDPSAFIGCTELERIFIPDNTFDEFEKLLPKYREILMEEVTIENHKGHRRLFSKKELEIVIRAKVVQGQYTKLVCIYKNDGCQIYIPLCKQSHLSIGDEVDMNKARLIEFNDEGIYYGLHIDGYEDVQKYLVEA